MTVSPVRRRLNRLGPSWKVPGPAEQRGPSAARGRAEAVGWVRRQLAWEHRLTDLREARKADGDAQVSERAGAIPLPE